MAQTQVYVDNKEQFVATHWNKELQFAKMEEFTESILMQQPYIDSLFQSKSNTALYSETTMDMYRLWDMLHEDPPEIQWLFQPEMLYEWSCRDISKQDASTITAAWRLFVGENQIAFLIENV